VVFDLSFPNILEIITQILIIGGTVGGALHKWLNARINGATKRLDAEIQAIKTSVSDVRLSGKAYEKDLSGFERKQQQMEFQTQQLNHSHGQLEGMFQRFMDEVREEREDRHKDEKKIVAQLANIEANLNVSIALERGFERLAVALRREIKER
jgi:homoserine dehydrogenase